MSQLILQIVIVLTAALISGGIGFWLARQNYVEEFAYREKVLSTELARLKRDLSTEKARRKSAIHERDRLRRKMTGGKPSPRGVTLTGMARQLTHKNGAHPRD